MCTTRCSENINWQSRALTVRKYWAHILQTLVHRLHALVFSPLLFQRPWQTKNVSQSFGTMVSIRLLKTINNPAHQNNVASVENCQPASGASGYAIVDNIRRVANTYGVVTVFKAYLELDSSPKRKNLRSSLHSSGVSLIDCPHNGQKEVADKMILGMSGSLHFTVPY